MHRLLLTRHMTCKTPHTRAHTHTLHRRQYWLLTMSCAHPERNLARQHSRPRYASATSYVCDGCQGGPPGRRCHNDAARGGMKNETRPPLSCRRPHRVHARDWLRRPSDPETTRICVTALLHCVRGVFPPLLPKVKRRGPAVFADMRSPQKSPTRGKQTSSPRYISYSFTFAWFMLDAANLCNANEFLQRQDKTAAPSL